jgi:hypothetical protein
MLDFCDSSRGLTFFVCPASADFRGYDSTEVFLTGACLPLACCFVGGSEDTLLCEAALRLPHVAHDHVQRRRKM